MGTGNVGGFADFFGPVVSTVLHVHFIRSGMFRSLLKVTRHGMFLEFFRCEQVLFVHVLTDMLDCGFLRFSSGLVHVSEV